MTRELGSLPSNRGMALRSAGRFARSLIERDLHQRAVRGCFDMWIFLYPRAGLFQNQRAFPPS